jgi:hypothetical protein
VGAGGRGVQMLRHRGVGLLLEDGASWSGQRLKTTSQDADLRGFEGNNAAV